MKRIRSMKRKYENVAAIGLALVLSFVVFMTVEHTDLFLADIVGGPTVTFHESTDIGSYIDDDSFIVVAAKNIEDIDTLSMLLVFDPETVQVAADDIDSAYPLAYSSAGRGKGQIVLSVDRLQADTELMRIRPAGMVYDMVIGDTVLTFVDGTSESLVIETPR